jgi:hypothetical protein
VVEGGGLMEVTVTGRCRLSGWLLCEARQAGALLLKMCAPVHLVDTMARSVDNNYAAKSLIPLMDSDAAWLLSRQARKE